MAWYHWTFRDGPPPWAPRSREGGTPTSIAPRRGKGEGHQIRQQKIEKPWPFCRDPAACGPLGYCPRDPACDEWKSD
jgi:hypothetical protein